MKDVLENGVGDLGFASRMINGVLLLLMFIVLFFIAYTVIRLIMRSRNSYYSILRILGATQRNTRNILRIELITVMIIAVGLCSGFLVLVDKHIIDLPIVREYLTYVEPYHYGILFLVMLIMSLLIASRYSRKIFSQSAMRVYRGGEQA
jgi:predicted lysophospholipase L1 biosynthesis ABC-type transport system permease subunit